MTRRERRTAGNGRTITARGRILAGVTLSVLLGCAVRHEPSGEGLGSASLALGSVPADVRCVRIAVAGGQTVVRSFDVVAGSQAVLALGGLPLGADVFIGDAFPFACADIGSSVPTWVSDPVEAAVSLDAPVQVTLEFHPNGRANVTGDFAGDGGDSGAGVPHTTGCDSTGCACVPGFADCNGTLVDGCEIDTTSDPANCGGCGVACAAGATCVRGACESVSDAGPAGEGGSDAGDTGPGEASAPDAPSGPLCTSDAGVVVADGGTFVPLGGTLRQILVDPCNAHVYVSNQSNNQIEDYSIAANTLEPPIAVGSEPNGFDVTADGARLYVANTGGTNLSVVDLMTRTELRKISTPTGFSNDTPLSLAIAANGKALFSTTFAGSGFGAHLLSLDLATETISPQTDFFINGTTTEATVLKASGDRSAVAAVAGDISSAPVFLYRAATGTFSPERDLNGFISEVAVNRDGSELLVDGTIVLDGGLNQLGTIVPGGGPWAVFAPSGHVAYRVAQGGIDVIDTTRFAVTGTLPVVADTMAGALGGSSVGNVAISSDGAWLVVITDHGITFVGLR
jgi:DNA-binding beta-propeller fold protein YncE